METITTPVEGGWHARDADTGLTYFGETEDAAIARLEAVKATFLEIRRHAREERQAEAKPITTIESADDAEKFLRRIYEPTPQERKGGDTAERVRQRIEKAKTHRPS